MEEDQNSPIKKLEKEIVLAPPKLPAIFADKKSVVLEQGLDREIAEASSIYSFFTTNITNLIGRYASEDYTDNHKKKSLVRWGGTKSVILSLIAFVLSCKFRI